MSLEQTFSQKLTLDKEASSSSTNSSEPTISCSKPSLPKGQSFRGIGRRRPSPLRNQPSLNREDSVGGLTSGSPGSPGNHAYAASTVGGVDRAHSIRLTRKIFHNWRSACGKTKDRTKDFIRRWKTLPENHPDFDNIVTSPTPSGSGSNIPGSTSASIYHAESHSGFAKLKNVPKKSSEHEIAPLNRAASVCHDDSGPSGSNAAGPSSAGKSSTGWTVHVWG
ncbi:unnamed protein product [Allacma fusca]|uniref:Uncharacterized protein n=1 Tax=Allacma fusca TaxID=39272 RepID=A0A8J2P885_9HEXA|nr:unnamed protein product [Allacma fusca]